MDASCIIFPLCMSFLNVWISNRNLLCRQWSHKEGNWPSKRIHCETAGLGEGSDGGDGNNTRWGLYGENFLWTYFFSKQQDWNNFFLVQKIGVYKHDLIYLFQFHFQLLHWQNKSWIKIFRGDSVPILVWIIKLLKLPKKLSRSQKSLI